MDGSRLMINLDGEYGGDAPTLFTNHQQHIKIIGNTSDYADPIEEAVAECRRARRPNRQPSRCDSGRRAHLNGVERLADGFDVRVEVL